MALDFPRQPQNPGTIYQGPNGITYTWDGVKWVAAGTSSSGQFGGTQSEIVNGTSSVNIPLEDGNVYATAGSSVWTLNTDGNFVLPLEGDIVDSLGNSVLSAVNPSTLRSTAIGIPEINSSTDLNLNAANRVNIVNSPLNLGSVIPNTVIGKPGDIIYHPALGEIQAYINGAWENLLRTAENQNVRLPQGGSYQRADGVRAVWQTELPTDISQLTDNNNLLTTQSITLQNIDIDGGGAYSIYETGLMFADGGFGSSRFGPSDTVFDGAGANSTYTTTLNGGGA